jgi:hypothetical protein
MRGFLVLSFFLYYLDIVLRSKGLDLRGEECRIQTERPKRDTHDDGLYWHMDSYMNIEPTKSA